jgi:P22 coat protein - gene protein 5
MANALITPNWVLKRVGRIAINNLKFANNVDRSYNDEYVQAGAKVGDTISLRLPQRFVTTKGQAFQQQAIVDKIVPVTLTDQANVGISFSSFQMTVDVDDYNSRYVEPAAVQLANTIDFDGLSRIQNLIYNAVGTPGTNPTANSTYLNAFALLSNLAAPPRRNVITSVDMQTAITAANFALFNPSSTIAESFREGVYATNTLGFREWYWDQNVAIHTNGTFSGTPLVNGANQTGSSLITDGWGSGVSNLNVGDKFTLGPSAVAGTAGVYSVNPQNYQSTGTLQEFRVVAPINDTTGAMTITIDPPIITSGALQTVTASPVDNAVISVFGTTALQYHAAIAWVKEAVVMVMADLVEPQGGALSERIRSKPLGFALRFVKQYNILSDQNLARIDGIYGYQAYRPEWCCVVAGA